MNVTFSDNFEDIIDLGYHYEKNFNEMDSSKWCDGFEGTPLL